MHCIKIKEGAGKLFSKNEGGGPGEKKGLTRGLELEKERP